MKRQKGKALIPKKKQKVIPVHNHKSISFDDLDEYELILYRGIRSVFFQSITRIKEPLKTTALEVAERYIDNAPQDETFFIPGEPWKELYLEGMTAFIDSYIPDIVDLILQDTKTITEERLLSIVVTESTRITSSTSMVMMLVYNAMYNQFYGDEE